MEGGRAVDSPTSQHVEFASWDEVQAELAEFGSREQLERAKRELKACLHAYKLAEAHRMVAGRSRRG